MHHVKSIFHLGYCELGLITTVAFPRLRNVDGADMIQVSGAFFGRGAFRISVLVCFFTAVCDSRPLVSFTVSSVTDHFGNFNKILY